MDLRKLALAWQTLGLDPATFGGLTLAQLEIWMLGAQARSRRSRSDQAEAVFMGTNASAKELKAYQAELDGPQGAQTMPPEALEGYMRQLSKGLQAVSLSDILATRTLQ